MTPRIQIYLKIFKIVSIRLTIILLLLLKKIGNARPGEGD